MLLTKGAWRGQNIGRIEAGIDIHSSSFYPYRTWNGLLQQNAFLKTKEKR